MQNYFAAGAFFFRSAHRALMEAASFARPSRVKPPFFFGAVFVAVLALAAGAFCLNFAQRAVAAAAIRARPAADMLRFPGLRADSLLVLAAVPGLDFGLPKIE